jgi:NAD(P)-dependent dehydrogenase (short-subunit alcohol dehydrogenase family)
MGNRQLISTGNLIPVSLSGKIAIVTGAGSGIGFEAARSLVWLGAKVIIAEIDKKTGVSASNRISEEFGADKVLFIQTDVGDERSVQTLSNKAIHSLGKVDIVLNNVAVEPIGAIKDAAVESWDLSYKVNLRGPLLLARAFLPHMLEQNSGVFVCVSSVGGVFMGPYEVLKRAQVELSYTITSECEGTGVVSFVIGPGLVPDTLGASEQIPKIARMMGKTIEEFQDISRSAIISMEAAGAGFAAAVALAPRFRGQEISSFEALTAAGIDSHVAPEITKDKSLTAEEFTQAAASCRMLRLGLEEQLKQWQDIGIFQRQWMTRDFSKRVGMPIEKVTNMVGNLERILSSGKIDGAPAQAIPFAPLSNYFTHLQEMTQGYVKDEKVRAEQIRLQQVWKDSVEKLNNLLN